MAGHGPLVLGAGVGKDFGFAPNGSAQTGSKEKRTTEQQTTGRVRYGVVVVVSKLCCQGCVVRVVFGVFGVRGVAPLVM